MLHHKVSLPLRALHRFWRLLPVTQRRRVFSSAAAFLAPRPDRSPPPPREGVVVAGELSRPSGLGEAARLMQAAIANCGIATWGADFGDPLLGGGRGPWPRDVPDGAPLLLHANGPVLPGALLRLPRRLIRRRRVIGYWAWELPVVPESWRIALSFVHEIWALSHFTGAAFQAWLPEDSGIPVRIVPIPLAVTPPRPAALDRAAFGLPADAVVVLVSFSLASSNARKNPLGAIAAFRQAFGTRHDRLLVLKVRSPEHFPEEAAALQAAIADAPNIRMETRTFPDADRHALTACADIVLSLHRSEGFGLVPAEAMLLGRPVVATGWSGNMDFMDTGCAALVGYRLVPAQDPRGVFEAPGAVWAEPDLGEAAAQLRRLADDPLARATLGARGREAALARLGPAPVAAALAGLGLAVPGPVAA
ncbi:Glycosyltransferase family 4 protein [Rhodovastum atsumiense]|uniref:Glycosyltransferase family 4 protein n=1 Tax=Rhodovastum atsumiense TaxID=504468 RepID=A0A5M6J279_9PROT|nr:glycosyltransferase family 4 protein [Rhodovastum atsumiense]KAA5614339.1 glycosyltransferase family 4 protein [Rhodovastum atsumiense]CAH2604808.1 Glycosyltransferase family 4 protein [Rhodovastum atsumiense]